MKKLAFLLPLIMVCEIGFAQYERQEKNFLAEKASLERKLDDKLKNISNRLAIDGDGFYPVSLSNSIVITSELERDTHAIMYSLRLIEANLKKIELSRKKK